MSTENENTVVPLSKRKIACKDCSLFQICLPVGISGEELERLEQIIQRRRPVKRGDHLYQGGDQFRSIYAVRSGSIKSYVPTESGNEQVTGFHLPGELLGLDAISNRIHPCSAKALETTSVCEIPYDEFELLSNEMPVLHRQLITLMSKEIFEEETHTVLLGKKSAEERLAAYLFSISSRYHRRGFSASEFYLSMSRNDIGNYLGLAVETVSRMFTRFQEDGLLSVERKHIIIHDLTRLKTLAGAVPSKCGEQFFCLRNS
ncbi:MAG TPA: fumarate/nitrate reduction transcriptional regulator Fnr [Gammaproteobacteria bacterium]|nr:fumarate/nitrate reduction transcriptional regulator Fnr [Gammaproteobacteria bacterium]